MSQPARPEIAGAQVDEGGDPAEESCVTELEEGADEPWDQDARGEGGADVRLAERLVLDDELVDVMQVGETKDEWGCKSDVEGSVLGKVFVSSQK